MSGKSSGRYGGTISEATFSHDGYQARTEAYSYDGFERLTGTSAFIGGGTSPVTVNVEDGITYDATGNVTALTRHGPSGTAAAQLSMTYSGNHRTQVTDSVTGNTWTGTYREDGTLMTDGRSGYSYADNLIGLVSQVAHTFSGPGGDDLLVSGSYTYLPDGTKTESWSLITWLYRGSVVYKKILADQLSLETLSLPDVIVSVTDTVWTPLAMVTDHLGSVRAVVSMKTGGIVERNDYYTYGTRITKPASDATAYPSLSSNRWRYAAKEEQSGVTGIPYDDFGARQYDPFTASWLAPDPLAGDYPGISPYAYCAGNPVNLVDRDGRDAVKYEDANGNIVIEQNIVILLEEQRRITPEMSDKEKRRITRRNNRIEERNNYKLSMINGALKEWFPEIEISEGKTVKFVFNIIEQYTNNTNPDPIEITSISKENGIVVSGPIRHINNNQTPIARATVITTGDTNGALGKTQGMRTISLRDYSYSTIAHEVGHTMGLTHPLGGANAGLMHYPPESITLYEIQTIINYAYNK